MTFSPVFQRAFTPTFDRRNAGAFWWNLFGAIPNANVIAAYAAKGAASLAASYTNLVTPGTYDAAPGTAPTWDAVNGWIFNGTSQFLTTGITPAATSSQIIRFTGATNLVNYRGPYGSSDATGLKLQLAFIRYTNATNHYYANNATLGLATGQYTAGVTCVTTAKAYKDGLSLGNLSGTPGLPTAAVYIGTWNNNGAAYFTGGAAPYNVQAFAYYSISLSDAQVALLSTYMAAL